VIILPQALPQLKPFLRPLALKPRFSALLVRCLVAFVMHCGRMAACRAATAVRSQPCHRAQITRFLGRQALRRLSCAAILRAHLLALDRAQGTFLFIVDQTLCGQQGQKTQNTFSRGNRQRRPRKGRRYSKYRYARKSCHCFVMGLLITPTGIRLPFCKSYYTRDYCQAKQHPYRTQTELAAELIAELPLPEGADLVVLGDTAFDAKCIRAACAHRRCTWIVPVNPERVLAGPAGQRPKVRAQIDNLTVAAWVTVRLPAGRGPFVAQRRVSPHRLGPKVKARTYYVQSRRQAVHSVGEVQLVFSTTKQPQGPGKPQVQKILMTNDLSLTARQVVERYGLRWQVELFFKEIKSTLGFHQYRFRQFERVEGWVEVLLVTVLYLEWYRARQLQRRTVSAVKKQWWRWQRAHGICLAVRHAAERADLQGIARRLQTPTGLQGLQKMFRQALAKENRAAA
jgi:hypothetical protein